MTLSTEERDRIAEARRATGNARARWKILKQGVHSLAPPYRAVCGKKGCPGSLGIFEAVLAYPNDYAGLLADSVRAARAAMASIEQLVVCEQSTFGRTDLAPEIVAEQRAILAEREPWHRELMELSRANLRATEERQRSFAGGEDYLAKRPAYQSTHGRHFWELLAEPSHGEPGSKGEHRSQPIYHGHRTSGYHISNRGKRDREGYRVSRRPCRRDWSEEERRALEKWTDVWTVTGQAVFPPCLIVCAVCETINYVPLPDGMGVLVPGSDEPVYPAP